MTRVWTVGHSNHSLERFAGLLADSEIELVADVRSRPYSRFAPWSGRERLEASLGDRGVDYEFFGDSLGGRPVGEELYDSGGHALYGRMTEEPAFAQAIERLLLRASSAAARCEARPTCRCPARRRCSEREVGGRHVP